MISYAQNLVEYFRYSRQFYYLIIDPAGNYTYLNPFLQETLGCQSTDFAHTSFNDFPAFDHNKFFLASQQCLQTGVAPVIIETTATTKTGASVQIKWELSIITDEEGKPEAIQAIGINAPAKKELVSEMTGNIEQLRYQSAMLENVSDIIISCANDHVVRSWNKKAEIFYNIKAPDAIGKKITDLVQVDYFPITRDEAHNELYKKGIWKGEVAYHKPGGEKKYLFNTLSFVTTDYGERIGVMVVGKDITTQKKAEQDLKQSELFYRNLFADSLDGILLTDETGSLHFTSPSIKRILGFEPGEIIGRNAFEFVHPDDHEKALKSFLNEVTKSPEVKYIVVRLLKKTGEWLWCMVRGHNLLSNPHIGRIAVYFHDDSPRKLAEDALIESEVRFRHLIRDLEFGVIMRDAQGKALLCNKKVLDLTGLSEKEFLETTLETNGITFIKEDNSELPYKEHPSIVAGKTKKPVRDIVLGAFKKKNQEWVWLLVNADPILDKDRKLLHVITTFIDITERKKLEQQLLEEGINNQKKFIKATIEGQEKERKEIGKELHDNIGQHLTTTKLYLDLAREHADEETIELVTLATKGIADVINEVRKLSRSLTPPTLGDLGLVESVKDICDSLKVTQVFAIRFYHNNFEEKLLPENLKLMLFRIVQEQLNNIIRHAEASVILIRLITGEGQLMLVISDNGKGFDPSINKKGLGIKNIINRAELFNGKVEVNTAPEEGCTMIITVPLH
jgi:PAS domain S-box-containing protein